MSDQVHVSIHSFVGKYYFMTSGMTRPETCMYMGCKGLLQVKQKSQEKRSVLSEELHSLPHVHVLTGHVPSNETCNN